MSKREELLKETAHLIKTDVMDLIKLDGGETLAFLDFLFREITEDMDYTATEYAQLFAVGMTVIHPLEEEDME